MQSIHMDESTLVEKAIRQTVAWMKSSKKIIFFGVGTTFDFLKEMQGTLLPNGKNIYYVDTLGGIEDLLDPQTIIITICYSGTTKDVLEVIQTAILKGAKVVGITAFKDSPIVSIVHLPLLCTMSLQPFSNRGIVQERSVMDIVQKIGGLYEVKI